jgi:hypothetical protein
MKWLPNKQDKVIGREKTHKEVLLSITHILVICVGNKDMPP